MQAQKLYLLNKRIKINFNLNLSKFVIRGYITTPAKWTEKVLLPFLDIMIFNKF